MIFFSIIFFYVATLWITGDKICMCANAVVIMADEIKIFGFLKLLLHDVVTGFLNAQIEID